MTEILTNNQIFYWIAVGFCFGSGVMAVIMAVVFYKIKAENLKLLRDKGFLEIRTAWMLEHLKDGKK